MSEEDARAAGRGPSSLGPGFRIFTLLTPRFVVLVPEMAARGIMSPQKSRATLTQSLMESMGLAFDVKVSEFELFVI
jgi:hypothetical protein